MLITQSSLLQKKASFRTPLLKDHGGPISLERLWAEPILCRLGYVKRKATNATQKLPANFAEAKLGFHQRIKDEVEVYSAGTRRQLGLNLVEVSSSKLVDYGKKERTKNTKGKSLCFCPLLLQVTCFPHR